MTFIKNYKALTQCASQIRKDILKILECILNNANPEEAVKRSVSITVNSLTITDITIPLNKIKNIYVVGGGKASYKMAKALTEILGKRITEGIISVKEAPPSRIGAIKIIKAGHPIPTEKGIEASREVIKITDKAGKDDLIIALISGGGSALLPYPMEDITLSQLQKTNELLLSSGATINEINVVRKHISMIKGGKLSDSAYPAMVISLIISDVIGDDLSSIASGPTSPDNSTYEDAYSILKKFIIDSKVPSPVIETLINGMNGKIPETPILKSKVFSKTHNRIILNNLLALKAGEKEAIDSGYHTLILSSAIEGESKNAGILHAGIAREIASSSNPSKPPSIIFSGGETTVTLGKYSNSQGGPNQECVTGFATKMEISDKTVFLSIDSDGIDGNSKYAGGIIGGGSPTFDNIDLSNALRTHQSTKFLERINGVVLTGETGTNVNDIRILGVGV